MFDEVNVATALHRLAKLQPPGPGSHPSPIIYADQFQQLVAAVGRLLPQFEAQAVSNTMWGEVSPSTGSPARYASTPLFGGSGIRCCTHFSLAQPLASNVAIRQTCSSTVINLLAHAFGL